VPIDDLAPEDLRVAYLNHLISKVSQVSLSGIDPKAASDSEERLELRAVYTGLRTLTAEECKQLQNHERLEEMQGEHRRLSVLAQLDRHDRLVLLGDPGSGKSTFINFVALCLAGEILGLDEANLERLTEPLPQDDGDEDKEPEPQPWSHGAPLPVHVVLRDFAARGLPPPGERATARHLWDFIVGELDDAALGAYEKPLAQELLRKGGLLLLDGLDEVPEAKHRREQIKQAVEDFAGAFGKCRILVTSRTYAYQQQAWRLPNFEEAVLAPFETGQIRRFVDRWYAHITKLRGLHRDDAQGRAELLKRAITASERLQALAERPLLLTLMASLHAWRGGSLPEKREELYADTVDLLLDWWESPKVARDAEGNVVVQQPSLVEWLKVEDRDKVRDLLNELAYEAHVGQADLVGTADVPESELVCELMELSRNPDVKPKRLIEYLSRRAGLLVPRGVGVYTFPHRTFQEYLAACHLVAYDFPDQVAQLARSDPNRWREVTLLAAAATTARGSDFALWALVDALCYRDLSEDEPQSEPDAWGALLAGQALAESAKLSEISKRNKTRFERVVTHLVRLIEEDELPAVERTTAGDTLSKLGDPRPGIGLREDGVPDIPWVKIPAGAFKMGTHIKDIPSLENRFSEPEWYSYKRETPQREMVLPTYYISRYPITNEQFTAFVKAGGYRDKRYWTDAAQEEVWSKRGIQEQDRNKLREAPYDFNRPFNLSNHPVVGVTWYEAIAFCRWLTEQLHKKGELGPNKEISLPTEPQWEKAGRGKDGRIYPWGDKPDPKQANYSDTGIGTTSAIGCFPGGASPYGVEDMSGNVWEWCRTKWGSSDNDLEGSSRRVLRGGYFDLTAFYMRCAFRYSINPGYQGNNVGFRVCIVSQ
jgi:formylglycine-generating enzyme required for sulfatase activity